MNDSPQDLTGSCSIQQSWSEAVGGCYRDAERFRDQDKNLQRKLNDEAGVAEDIHVKRALFCVRPQHDQQSKHEHRAQQQRQCCDARQRAHSCKYYRHNKAKKQRHCAPLVSEVATVRVRPQWKSAETAPMAPPACARK